MPAYVSTIDDLVLHAPRVLGYASVARVAERYDLDRDHVEDLLLDFATRGWLAHARFDETTGWFVTQEGRAEGERRLAAELERAGVRDVVADAHRRFLPLNRRFASACADWQVRPSPMDPAAANDHADWSWDERVMRTLEALDRELPAVTDPLAGCLARFGGYDARYSAALRRVNAGRRRWVGAPDVDSCHTVWIQLHEDLLATLGIPRGTDA